LHRRVQELLAGFRRSVARIGLWNACLYATSRVLTAMFGQRVRIIKYYFMSQAITVPATLSAVRSGSFTLAFTKPDWELFSHIERPPEIIAARFAQGARCLAAMDTEAQFAGFLWFVTGPYNEDEVRARFDPIPRGKTAWDFDVTIVPRYRMGRLFRYLWERASVELAACGVQHSLSRISAFHGGSLASHRRLGAHVVGEAFFLCIGRVQLMKSTVGPKWHLSWREEQRPVLAIEA
jgi:hypothetical protein